MFYLMHNENKNKVLVTELGTSYSNWREKVYCVQFLIFQYFNSIVIFGFVSSHLQVLLL